MEPQTKNQVKEAMKGKTFNAILDMGCGYGEVAPILKKHTGHLIGVDLDTSRALTSGYDVLYDEIVQEDIRTYQIPPTVDAVTIFDVVEHIPMPEGLALLNRIGPRFIVLTTPSKFFSGALDGHVALWTEQQLQQLGFKTNIYSTGVIKDRVYGKKIIAVRNQ